MSKRVATSDINQGNWDEPYVKEEAGRFKEAPQDVVQKRVIRTAKRRIKTSESNDASKTPSVFSSFTGFKSVTPSLGSSTKKPFSFLITGSAISSNVTPPTNGTTLTAVSTKLTPEQKYLADLRQLNRSVTDWIQTHVDKNAECILSPVFIDYEKHLKQIQADCDAAVKQALPVISSTPASISSLNNFVSSSTSDNKFTINMPTTSVESDKNTFTFTDSKVSASSSDSKPTPPIFELKNETGKSPLLQETSTEASKPSSLFTTFKDSSTGSTLLAKPNPAVLMVNPFVKPVAKPFSFSNGSTEQSINQQQVKEKEEEDESDEPPKVEFTPVQEEGSVFSTRCKVFVKKENGYKERGVGTLFIKKVGENKHQLLVRAETVMGNVLLNVLLSNSIPTQRMGKNNVMLVCLPTPQDLPPPTTVLLRVKTDVEADELLATIEQYKPE